MSTNKISTKNLADPLAKRLGISQVAADNFLSEFYSVAEKAILNDKILKISGLGTFKMVWNEPRKSVNVQSGEPIEIAGHYKLSFIPEIDLKDKVNGGVTNIFEKANDSSVSANNAPLKKLGEQAEELKDILQSINGASTIDPSAQKNVTSDYTQPNLEQSIQLQEPSKEELEEIIIKLEDLEPKQEPICASDYLCDQPKCKKKRCCAIVWSIVIVILIGGLGCVYYFWNEPIRQCWKSVSETVVSWFACNKTCDDTSVVVPVDTLLEQPIVVAEPTIFEVPRTYTDFVGTEVVTEGSRLTWIAYKYYGNKVFWVYIYEANRETLPNPNKLPKGSKLKIPKLPDLLIDTSNPECLEYAKKLHEQYLK